MYHVYVLVSQSTGKRYVGQTDDLARRINEHNNPEHNRRKYTTRNQGPWELVHHELFETRAQAMARERQIKVMKSARWIREHLLNRKTGC